MEVECRPLFVTPFIFNEWTINSIINTAFVESLPDSFYPTFLCTKHSNYTEKGRLLMTNGNIGVRGLLRFTPQTIIQRLEQYPDIYYAFWYKSAVKLATAFLKKNKISYIHSFSIPYTSHLVACELKKRFDIPWIAQFYEPWGDNPYRRISDKIVSKNIYWEKECATLSDVIIHDNDKLCSHWKNKYGNIVKDKLFTLPMSFELKEENQPLKHNIGRDKLRISHVGNMYGMRRADSFIKALFELIQEKPLFRNKIEVYFVGRMNPDDISLVEKLGLQDVVRIVGVLSEKECESFYKNADIFLLVEAENQGPYFYPSKLVRYFSYNRPIFALTNTNSVTCDELRKSGHSFCSPSDISSIKAYLMKALADFDSLLEFDKNAWKKFDSHNVAKEYLKIVNNLLK